MSSWKEIRTVALVYAIVGIIYLAIMAGVVIGICLIVKWILF